MPHDELQRLVRKQIQSHLQLQSIWQQTCQHIAEARAAIAMADTVLMGTPCRPSTSLSDYNQHTNASSSIIAGFAD
jgi:hypothetical protein